jgi:hypothetical protein
MFVIRQTNLKNNCNTPLKKLIFKRLGNIHTMSLLDMFASLPENLQHNIRLKAVLMELTEDRYNHTEERKMLILSITRLWAAHVVYLDSGFSEHVCHLLTGNTDVLGRCPDYYRALLCINPFLKSLYDDAPYHFLFAMEYPLEGLQKISKILEDYR